MDWNTNIELMWRENSVWERLKESAIMEEEDGSFFDYKSSLKKVEAAQIENSSLDSQWDDTEYPCVPSAQYAIPKSCVEILRR